MGFANKRVCRITTLSIAKTPPKVCTARVVYDHLVTDVLVNGQIEAAFDKCFFSWSDRSVAFPHSSPLAAACELP